MGGESQSKGQSSKGGDKNAGAHQKSSDKTAGSTAKGENKVAKGPQSQKKISSSSSFCACIIMIYAIVVMFVLKTGVETVAEHPELLAMAASDVRLKKNIDISHYGMNEVLQLEPKSYHYINQDNQGTRHIGLMVQDVAKIMPELVVPLSQRQSAEFLTSDETMYGLKYQELIPVLINAIKELKSQVDNLNCPESSKLEFA